ncbi:MAG: hypothetical protein QXI16_03025 [Sulfolobaceae archaeon]
MDGDGIYMFTNHGRGASSCISNTSTEINEYGIPENIFQCSRTYTVLKIENGIASLLDTDDPNPTDFECKWFDLWCKWFSDTDDYDGGYIPAHFDKTLRLEILSPEKYSTFEDDVVPIVFKVRDKSYSETESYDLTSVHLTLSHNDHESSVATTRFLLPASLPPAVDGWHTVTQNITPPRAGSYEIRVSADYNAPFGNLSPLGYSSASSFFNYKENTYLAATGYINPQDKQNNQINYLGSCGNLDLYCHVSRALRDMFMPTQKTQDAFMSIRETMMSRAPFAYYYSAKSSITELTEVDGTASPIKLAANIPSLSSNEIVVFDLEDGADYFGSYPKTWANQFMVYAITLAFLLWIYYTVQNIFKYTGQ